MINAGLYHYFKNKQETLFDITDYAIEDALVNMREKLPIIENPEEKMAWIIRSQIKFYSGNKSHTKVLVHEREDPGKNYAEKIREEILPTAELMGTISLAFSASYSNMIIIC